MAAQEVSAIAKIMSIAQCLFLPSFAGEEFLVFWA
jgi:hypothetical protein